MLTYYLHRDHQNGTVAGEITLDFFKKCFGDLLFSNLSLFTILFVVFSKLMGEDMSVVGSMASSNLGKHDDIANLDDIANVNEARLNVVENVSAIYFLPDEGNAVFHVIKTML